MPMDVNTEAHEAPPGDAMETSLSEAVVDQTLQPRTENASVLPLSVTRRSAPRSVSCPLGRACHPGMVCPHGLLVFSPPSPAGALQPLTFLGLPVLSSMLWT